MATVVGCITVSPAPPTSPPVTSPPVNGASVNGKPVNGALEQPPFGRPLADGFAPVHRWLAAVQPDVAVVIHSDHGLNFAPATMPTFAVGAAPQYRSGDEWWASTPLPPLPGQPELSWHLIDSVMRDGFDLASCQQMLAGHAVVNPMRLLWPCAVSHWPVRLVPVHINTAQFPLPSARRCWRLGQAIGRAIGS